MPDLLSDRNDEFIHHQTGFSQCDGAAEKSWDVSTVAQTVYLCLHPSSLRLEAVWLLCNPSSTKINAALRLLPTQCRPGLSQTGARANTTASEPPHFCPANLEFATCASSQGGLMKGLVGALQALSWPLFTTMAWPEEVTAW